MFRKERSIIQIFKYKAMIKIEKIVDKSVIEHIQSSDMIQLIDTIQLIDLIQLIDSIQSVDSITSARSRVFKKCTLNRRVNHVLNSRMQRNKKLAKMIFNRLYHHLMIIDQTECAIIEVDNIDSRKRVIIKRVRCSEDPVYQISSFTCEQIVNIKDMYMKKSYIIFIYEQMNLSLQHMIDILQNHSLKIFQIATICREMMSNLLCMHQELELTHDALSCSMILLDVNESVKIDKCCKRIT